MKDQFLAFLENFAPPSRYKIPPELVPFFERIMVRLCGKLRDILEIERDDNSISPYWQKILQWLYRQDIITEPDFKREDVAEDVPQLFYLLTWSLPNLTETDGSYVRQYGRGTSFDFEEATSKTMGELLERYPLAVFKKNNFCRASISDLQETGAAFLDPSILAGFSQEQKEHSPNKDFNSQSIFYWEKGVDFLNGKEVLIPAQLVYWNYRVGDDEFFEPRLRETNTSGAGGFFTLKGAILSGLYELIQRDGFFVFWLNKIAPPRIELSSIKDERIKKAVTLFRRYELEPVVVEITSDISVPAHLCMLVHRDGKEWPAAIVGAGCNLSHNNSIYRAMIEAASIYHWAKTDALKGFELKKNYEPFRDYIDVVDRVSFWASPKHFDELRWFLSGPSKMCCEEEPLRSPKASLQYIGEILRQKGNEYKIYYYQARHPILKKLGYYSVKVIVPAFIPLYLCEPDAPLGAKRLQEVPKILGLGSPQTFPYRLPHPFP